MCWDKCSGLAWLGLVWFDYVCCRSRLDWLDWLGIYVICCPDVVYAAFYIMVVYGGFFSLRGLGEGGKCVCVRGLRFFGLGGGCVGLRLRVWVCIMCKGMV